MREGVFCESFGLFVGYYELWISQSGGSHSLWVPVSWFNSSTQKSVGKRVCSLMFLCSVWRCDVDFAVHPLYQSSSPYSGVLMPECSLRSMLVDGFLVLLGLSSCFDGGWCFLFRRWFPAWVWLVECYNDGGCGWRFRWGHSTVLVGSSPSLGLCCRCVCRPGGMFQLLLRRWLVA